MLEVTYSQVLPGIFAEEGIRNSDSSMSGYHFHKGIEFLFMLEGERYYFVDQYFHHLQKGMAILINANQFHKASMVTSGSPGHRRFLLQLDADMLDKSFSLPDYPSIREYADHYQGTAAFSEKDWCHVLYLIEMLKEEMPLQTAESNSLSLMIVRELLTLFMRARKNNRISESDYVNSSREASPNIYHRIQAVTVYLRSNCCRTCTVDEIAGHFYFSRSYLSRVFKVVTGYTIMEYKMVCQVQKSCELLEKTDLSITEVAAQTGFGNITYFERIFRRIKHTTPLKYRKQSRLPQL